MNIGRKEAEMIDWVRRFRDEDLDQILDKLKDESLTGRRNWYFLKFAFSKTTQKKSLAHTQQKI